MDPVRVLHVDDDPRFAELTATYLNQGRNNQFDTVSEVRATDALDYLRASDSTVDCIVSDYALPGMDGLEFLQEVRDIHPDLPFIFFTGKGSEEVASDALRMGATDYLQKQSGSEQYELLANRIQNAVSQLQTEHRADNLERIRRLVREINQTLIRASSVDEIERKVCELISNSDPYLTTCIAGVDSETMRIDPRVWAGADEAFFEELDMVIEGDSPGYEAPGGRAFHDREMAFSQNIHEDPSYAKWRDAAIERGFQSLAVVPIEYGDELYGLLAIFASRREAFDETEAEMLSELGDDIAHAIHTRKLRTRLEALFDNSPDMIDVLDGTGTIQDVNARLREELGYSEAELLGMNIWEIDQSVDARDVHELLSDFSIDERRKFEGRYERRDGSTFPVEVHLLRLDLGDEDSFLAISRDITERKKRERDRERIINRVTDAIVEVDSNWRFTLVDQRAEELYGMDETELLGEDFWDVFPEARDTRFEEEYRTVMETREPTSFVEYYTGLDGWFEIDVYPREDGGISFYFQDVTG